MLLDGGRKPEYPERTHAYTGRTCRLPTERPQLGIEPGTLLLRGDGANHHNSPSLDIISFIGFLCLYWMNLEFK